MNLFLKSLSHPQWEKVNIYMADAFSEFRKHTPQGYSTCITKTISSLQAFLQIAITGSTGSGEISKLISQAQTKGLIPSDAFTKTIFKNIEGVLAQERQTTGDAHLKDAFANEKNAIMVLNLAMVFFQHCLLRN